MKNRVFKKLIILTLICIFGVSLCASESVIASTSTINEKSEEKTLNTKKDNSSISIDDNRKKINEDIGVYRSFLGIGKEKAGLAKVDELVSTGLYDCEILEPGDDVSFDDINQRMKEATEIIDVLPPPVYSIIYVEETPLLAIKYEKMGTFTDGSYLVLFIKNKEDGLHVTTSLSSWDRQDRRIHRNGYIYTHWPLGAGENVYEGGILNKNGKYNSLFTKNSLHKQWLGAFFEVENYWDLYSNNNDDSGLVVEEYIIGENKYYTYNDNIGPLTKGDKKCLEYLKKSGIEFANEEEIENAIFECNKNIIKNENYDDYASVIWIDIMK